MNVHTSEPWSIEVAHLLNEGWSLVKTDYPCAEGCDDEWPDDLYLWINPQGIPTCFVFKNETPVKAFRNVHKDDIEELLERREVQFAINKSRGGAA